MKSTRADVPGTRSRRARGSRSGRRFRLLALGALALPAFLMIERGSGSTSPLARAAAQAAPIEIHLPAEYQTTWDPGIPEGIPADDDPIRPARVWLPSNDPYQGYSVNPALTRPRNAAAFTAALQAAIAAAAREAAESDPVERKHRRIIRLKAGNYFVTPQQYRIPNAPNGNPVGRVGIFVDVDNVTIRGEGANTTRLTAAGRIGELGTVVLFGHRSGWASNVDQMVRRLAIDAARGANVITLSESADYKVGDVITIDRKDGSPSIAPAVVPPSGYTGPALGDGPAMFNDDYLWFYDAAYFKRQPVRDWNGPGTGAPPFGSINGGWPAINLQAEQTVPHWRSRMQTNEIVAISGNTLTLKDPLHLDFPVSGASEVWRSVPIDSSSVPMGNRWSGIEDIAVAGGNNDWGFPGGTVAFSYMAYGWAKNIEADGDKGRGPNASPGKWGYNIGVGHSYRVVIRDSYAHGSADITPGGHAYGIVVGMASSACLVENNISVNNNKPIALNATGGGNVIGYNYVDQAIIWSRTGVSNGWQENAIDDNHGNFTHHDLIEGNWTPNIGGDTTHGNSGWHTHLRNYAHGTNLLGGAMTSNLRAVGMDGWTHDHAYIGNVLNGGTVYETTPFSTTGTPVYQLGNNYAGVGGNWDNGYAWAHIYRDGNWDNVTGLRWAGPSCEPAGSCSIPDSFYLSSRPAFFTAAYDWPWVNPQGTTSADRVKRLPAKARFDAGTPNVAVP